MLSPMDRDTQEAWKAPIHVCSVCGTATQANEMAAFESQTRPDTGRPEHTSICRLCERKGFVAVWPSQAGMRWVAKQREDALRFRRDGDTAKG